MKGTAIYRSPVGAIQLEYEDGEVVSLRKAEEDAVESEENALAALVFRQLDEYFAGTRRSFDFPCRAQGTPFQRKVWAALRDIPYGETRTYGDIAGQSDSRKPPRGRHGEQSQPHLYRDSLSPRHWRGRQSGRLRRRSGHESRPA